MTRKILIFSIFLVAIQTSFCQVKLDYSSTWTIASISMGSYYKNEIFKANGDTVINTIAYKSIFKTIDSIFDISNSTYFCALREENKEWFIIPDNDSVEHLLYDFNINQGDTVTTYNQATGDVDLNVFKTDSILLNNKYYKRFELGIYDKISGRPSWPEYWIEGIGSTNGFYIPGFHLFDVGYQLLCFHQNDTMIFNNSPDGTCRYIKVGKEELIKPQKILLSPNPVTDFIIVDSDKNLKIIIYDLTGNKVLITEDKQVDVSNLQKGLYEIKIFDNKNNYITTEKVLKK